MYICMSSTYTTNLFRQLNSPLPYEFNCFVIFLKVVAHRLPSRSAYAAIISISCLNSHIWQCGSQLPSTWRHTPTHARTCHIRTHREICMCPVKSTKYNTTKMGNCIIPTLNSLNYEWYVTRTPPTSVATHLYTWYWMYWALLATRDSYRRDGGRSPLVSFVKWNCCVSQSTYRDTHSRIHMHMWRSYCLNKKEEEGRQQKQKVE